MPAYHAYPPSGADEPGGLKAGRYVCISVSDTGEGIPPELLPRVFERFVKGPQSPGSGLGLAIAHDIVAAHGGTLEIQSNVGSGTTVSLELHTGADG